MKNKTLPIDRQSDTYNQEMNLQENYYYCKQVEVMVVKTMGSNFQTRNHQVTSSSYFYEKKTINKYIEYNHVFFSLYGIFEIIGEYIYIYSRKLLTIHSSSIRSHSYSFE
jgi:hypothetical protein